MFAGLRLLRRFAPLSLVAVIASSGCDDHGGHHHTEVMSKVELTFQPNGGGDPIIAVFSDPDGDGGVSGTADNIELPVGGEYTLGLRFINELADPIEDLTPEIQAEAEEHYVLIHGDVVAGPASAGSPALVTHAYADAESDYGANETGEDLPVGLSGSIVVNEAGTGTFRVMLRHLPPLNGTPQKTADVPDLLVNGDALPGEVDVDVAFPFAAVDAR